MTRPPSAPLVLLLVALAVGSTTAACASSPDRAPREDEAATTLPDLDSFFGRHPTRSVCLEDDRELVIWAFYLPWSELEPAHTWYLALTHREKALGANERSDSVDVGGWIALVEVPQGTGRRYSRLTRAEIDTLLAEDSTPRDRTAIVQKLGWLE